MTETTEARPSEPTDTSLPTEMADPVYGRRQVGDRLGRDGGGRSPGAEPEPEEEQLPKVPVSVQVRQSLAEFNPWHIARGYPVFPMVLVAATAMAFTLMGQAFQLYLPRVRELPGGSNILVIGAVGQLSTLAVTGMGLGFGYLADRMKRVYFLRVGYTITAGAYMLMGTATSIIPFVGCQVTAGLGNSIAQAGGALLADYYPPAVRLRSAMFQVKLGQVAIIGGPLLAGLLSTAFGWQWGLIVISGFLMLVALGTFALREPVRGAQDRIAVGADPNAVEARPPGFAESWRTLFAVRTLRRLWIAIPLLNFALGATTYALLYFNDVWRLGEQPRSLIASGIGAAGLAGAAGFGGLQARLSEYKPGRLLHVAAICVLLSIACTAAIIISPFLWLSIILVLAQAALLVTVYPMMGAMILLVVPARVRSLGAESLALVSLAALPYVFLIWPRISDFLKAAGFGITPGNTFMFMGIPAALAGAYFLNSAASRVERDVRSALAVGAAEEEIRTSRQQAGGKMIVCRDIDVHYGGTQVLYGIDLDIDEGECVALLGTNGAGKSTLLRAMAGIVHASSGAIFMDGADITHSPTHLNAALGLVMVPGGHAVFPHLTVEENLRTATWMERHNKDEKAAKIEEVLGYFPILKERWSEVAGNMSGGEQQMLALSQAFLMRPRLLMIDELSLGLAPQVVEKLLDIVRRIHAGGTTVVLVEQSVNIALSIAKRAVFMEKGQVRYDGPAAELLEHREILRSVFLGEARRSVALVGGPSVASRGLTAERERVLETTGIEVAFGGVQALDGASISVRAGEIVGIVGPNGAGKTTLFDVVSGFVEPDHGSVLIAGTDVTAMSPDRRAKQGLARSFQNALLFPTMTVREGISVSLERHLQSRSAAAAALRLPAYRASERRAQRRVDGLVESLGLGAYADKFINELSTGTRRIVDLACLLAQAPQILLLDEPSSGLAQTETEELGPFINRIRKETGCAILVIEHDIALISTLSDRLIAMQTGRVLRDGEPDEVLQDPVVMEALMGSSGVAQARSGAMSA